jgi:predicted metal-dependent peptidase
MTTEVAKRATDSKNPAMWEPTKKSDAEVLDYLIRARVKLLISAPFFGTIATRLKFIDASKWCPTAATDGKNFYYNKDFVAALQAKNEGQVEFLVGHESLHCVYDHMDKTQLGKRDVRLANVAQDYVINGDLVEANIGTLIDLVQICHDYKYRNMHWLEVYDELFRQAEEEGRVINLESLDVHLDMDDGEGEAADGNTPAPGEAGNDGKEAPIKYSDEEKEQIKNEMQSAVLQSAKVAGTAGNLPSGVKRLVDGYLNPQLDWKELLAMQIQSVIKSDYTMLNPSRKGMDAGMYLPGMDYENTIDIALALDMSGSILDEMAREMLSEVKGIMEQYNGFRIHLFCFDTEVHNPQVFTEHNMDEFMDYELGGGGGTEFDVCWDYMKEEGIVPQKFVMFTDGYPWNSWGDESYCDTLFIVHGTGYGGRTPEAPFGITVPYKQEK